MLDQGFQTWEDLFNGDIFLAEIHDHTVAEYIVVHGRCIIESTAFRDFPEDFLVPIDDVFHIPWEWNMDNMFPSKQFICSKMDQAGCLAHTMTGNKDTEVPSTKSTIQGLFKCAKRTQFV